MTNNKPWTIKVIIGLFITRLIFIFFFIITFGIVKDIDSATRTSGAGVKEAMVRRFNLDMSDSGYAFGTLIGTNLIPALVAILGIIFILNRKYIPTLITLIIDLLIGLGMMNPFMAIINIVLFLLKRSKKYMKGIDEP